jgi:hypothetical protein
MSSRTKKTANGKNPRHRHRKLLIRDSIVFSYWRRSLDVVGALLTDKQIPYLRVDGTTPPAKRREVLDMFQKQGDVSVLLMTLGTGAVGYYISSLAYILKLTLPSLNNLTVAHRLHLLEPQWNPSVESQAIGRIVRLGQTRPVTVLRYVISETVEQVRVCAYLTGLCLNGLQNVRKIQRDKQRLFNRGFSQVRLEVKSGSLSRVQVRDGIAYMIQINRDRNFLVPLRTVNLVSDIL